MHYCAYTDTFSICQVMVRLLVIIVVFVILSITRHTYDTSRRPLTLAEFSSRLLKQAKLCQQSGVGNAETNL